MSPAPSDRREGTLARTAAVCGVLVFVVVASSAWLRIVPAGAPCPPGACDAFTLADFVRLSHRVAAMGVSILALLLAALAWRRPAAWGRRGASVAAILLVAVLAIVGRQSAGDATPAVVLTNLLGGLALLAVVAGIGAAAFAASRPPSPALATGAAILACALAAGALVLMTLAPAQWPVATWLHNVLCALALVAAITAAFASRATAEAEATPQGSPAGP